MSVLVCVRVADMAEPYVPSRRRRCGRCRCQVWASRLAPAAQRILCWPCSQDERTDEIEIEIAPETQAEVAEYMRRKLS